MVLARRGHGRARHDVTGLDKTWRDRTLRGSTRQDKVTFFDGYHLPGPT